MSNNLPTIIGPAGLTPRAPAVILAELIASVAAVRPGYTANLPGSLIEDISSTDVAAIVQMEAARVDAVNSLTPYAANDYTLAQLGQIYGVPIGEATNTSVFVIFTGTPGFIISKGFTISDGTYQYVIQDGGVIGTDTGGGLGVSVLLFALAVQSGSWAVPAGTVQEIITTVPGSIQLSVNNPDPGLPGASEQTPEAYRAQVLQAGLAAAQGMPSFLKTLLGNIDGVQERLISVVQGVDGWEVIVGGGDPYYVANAILTALFDVSSLKGSVISITDITKAAQAVITTDINHGKEAGDEVTINDVLGMLQINGQTTTVNTVLGEKEFSVDINSLGYNDYTSGGRITPNERNIEVSLNDFPDIYIVTYVNPPQQSVAMSVAWNTISTNLVSPAAIQQLAIPALVDYINGIVVGQPINLYQLESTFKDAVVSILPPNLLTRMEFSVSINGIGTPPDAGTGIIAGDPESYFLTDSTLITVNQG